MSPARATSVILFVAFVFAGFRGEAQASDTATTLSADNVSGKAGAAVTIKATLKTTGRQQSSPLPNKRVRLYFRQYTGNNYTQVHRADGYTDSRGVVKFAVSTPSVAGKVHVYDLVYEGDATTRRSTRYVQVTAK